MGNRKRYSKRLVNTQPTPFKVNDPVVVKTGVNGPEYGSELSGWHKSVIRKWNGIRTNLSEDL
jgi:hypothetical protein